MASPMRDKRAWSTRENDAESKETAAFEASVAAAKDTAAKSGAFLSDVKEDLTDHRRWLQAQTVAVERDRARHERWLQRQRDHREAQARRERTKRRRQLMRQRAGRAIQQAVWASLLFVKSLILLAVATVVAGVKATAGLIARGAVFVGVGLRDFALFVWHLLAAGTRWTAAMLGAFGRWLGELLSAGTLWTGAKTQAAARAGGSALATGSAFVAAKAGSSARASGSALAAGSSLVAQKAGVVGRSAGRSVGGGLSFASTKGAALAGATGRATSRGLDVVSQQASALASAGKRQLGAGYRWTKSNALAIMPALYVRVAKYGRRAERYARARAARADTVFGRAASPAVGEAADAAVERIDRRPANDPGTPETIEAPVEVYGPFYEGFWVEGVSPNEPRETSPEIYAAAPAALPPRVKAENALSLRARSIWVQTRFWAERAWAHTRAWTAKSWSQTQTWTQTRSGAARTWASTRDFDLSQMMIIAGAVLLVCGGLLLGGGLFMRAGAGAGAGTPEQASEESPGGIAWTFEETDRPLPERAVFTLSGTPASFRINGISVSGLNQSDAPLTSIEAVLKPDVKRPDLKLTLQVDQPAAAGEGDAAAPLQIVAENTVPAHAPFRLVFPFPPEAMGGEDGITVEEFFESYGGLLLKLRYESDGAQKSVIQYLPPALLRAQLEEVTAGAGG
jgi:hypothetical protein